MDEWRTIATLSDWADARTAAVSIAAMQFDVRIVRKETGEVITESDLGADEGESVGTLLIQTRPEHAAELQSVMDDLLEEQHTFNAQLDHGDARRIRVSRVFILAAILAGLLFFLLKSDALSPIFHP